MSKETIEDLNLNTLIGYTEKRGNAWHYREQLAGGEANHYPGAVPIEAIKRRLFDWQAVEGELVATHIGEEGVISTAADSYKAIMRSDTGAVLGIFSQGYTAHQYGQWLIDNVEVVLGTGLQVGSAGLLKGGAQAWVQIEMPETLTGAEGVEFRPFLTATTSLDGSIATTYLTGAQVVVCDNTLSAALYGADDRVKIRHTRNSGSKLDTVAEGLGLVSAVAEHFEAQVKKLTSEYVSDSTWMEFVNRFAYVPPAATVRTHNTMLRLRGTLNDLWRQDSRVAPWKNSAYGVVAAVNTYEHHLKNVRGTTRAERNMGRVVTGGHDKLDRNTLEILASVR